MKKFMIPAIILLVAGGYFLPSAISQTTAIEPDSDLKSPAELVKKYPSMAEGTTRPENKKILCPFLRILERAGMFDAAAEEQGPLTTSIIRVATAAREFGCTLLACGGVATKVSMGQAGNGTSSTGMVNLEALHTAEGVAHECGLTFAPGGTEISDAVRESTLAMLAEEAEENGRLSFHAIDKVKNSICAEQGVAISEAGAIEVKLIYTFLGGMDRGYVDLSDVRRLFYAEMPETKNRTWIGPDLFKELDRQLKQGGQRSE